MKSTTFLHAGICLAPFVSILSSSQAFVPNHHAVRSERAADSFKLNSIIKGEEEGSVPFDIGKGGVRLAEESAIKISGTVKHKPGKADAKPMELSRYNNIIQVDESAATAVLQKTGSKIICTGSGVELYTDPGEGTATEVKLAPMEAIKDALAEASSAIESKKLVFNFLGGDDLMMFEVLDASSEMVLKMDVATKASISFNSLCHSSVPSGTCTVSVISVGDSEGEDQDFAGEEKAVASGEIYLHNGKWWTASESDINTSVA